MESCQNVDVICRTANFQELAFFASDNSTDVRVEIASQNRIDAWDTVLGAEYDVIREASVRAHWTLFVAIVACLASVVPSGLCISFRSLPQVETG